MTDDRCNGRIHATVDHPDLGVDLLGDRWIWIDDMLLNVGEDPRDYDPMDLPDPPDQL